MLKGQKSEIHEYYDNMTQSISYHDDEFSTANQDYKRTNSITYPCRIQTIPSLGINNISQTYSLEEQSCQIQRKSNLKYKCFKCFGLKNEYLELSIHSTNRQTCLECNGSQYISHDNGIAYLLEKVIQSKYPQLFVKKDNINTMIKLPTSKSIQQQYSPQNMDNSQCCSCYRSLLPNSIYTCQICPNYNICSSCFVNKKYFHQNHHKLIHKENIQSLRIFSKYCHKPVMKKISQEMQPVEIQTHLLENSEFKCDNCCQIIEDCYQSCLNCQEQGFRYIICDICSSSKQYKHFQNHELAMKTLPNKSNKIYSKFQLSQSINLQAINTQQSKKDEPYIYISKIKPANSLIGVYLDDQNSIAQMQSEISLSNNPKDYNFFDMFPKLDQPNIYNQPQYEEKRSDVTPYEGFTNYSEKFEEYNIFQTPKKSISPIKKDQNTKTSTQISRSPKKSQIDDLSYFNENSKQQQVQFYPINLPSSTICIELQASTEYQNKDKNQFRSSIRTLPLNLQNANLSQSILDQSNHSINNNNNYYQMQKSKICIQLQNSLDYQFINKPVYKKYNYNEQKTNAKSEIIFEQFNAEKISPIMQSCMNNTFSPSSNQLDSLSPPHDSTLMQTSFQKSLTEGNALQQYIFHYTCDMCPGHNPIKNKRYHCRKCADFDLCQQCHFQKKDQHEHQQFELIDGLQLLRTHRKMKLDEAKKRISQNPRKSLISLCQTTFPKTLK